MSPTSRQAKRIAILTPSGVAPEGSGMHIPALFGVVSQLSLTHDITVYTFSNKEWNQRTGHCGNALVKFLPVPHNGPRIRKLYEVVKAFRTDHRINPFNIIHAFWALPLGLYGVILGKASRLPTVVSLIGGDTACLPQIPYGNMTFPSSRILTRFVCRHAEAIIVLSQFQKMQLQQMGINKPPNIVPFGVDTKQFNPNKTIRLSPPFRFIHVANLTPVKNQKSLLRIFKNISEKVTSTLRVVGPDFAYGSLQEYADKLKIAAKVEFTGYVGHSSLPQLYRSSHIMLHTSLHEAQGVTVNEAMASGVVVAGTPVGILHDLREISVVENSEAEERLADRIVEVLKNRKQFVTLRKAGLIWAAQHDIEWTVKKITDLYTRLTINSSSNLND